MLIDCKLVILSFWCIIIVVLTSHQCIFPFEDTKYLLWSHRLWWSRQTPFLSTPKENRKCNKYWVMHRKVFSITNTRWQSLKPAEQNFVVAVNYSVSFIFLIVCLRSSGSWKGNLFLTSELLVKAWKLTNTKTRIAAQKLRKKIKSTFHARNSSFISAWQRWCHKFNVATCIFGVSNTSYKVLLQQ